MGVPFAGSYKEIFCSDNVKFGGDGSKNSVMRTSKRSSCDGRSNSITIGLAPLSMSIFKLAKSGTESNSKKKKTTKPTEKKEVNTESKKKKN